LQTLTGKSDVTVNSSLVHPQDLVGTPFVPGKNPTTPTYTNATADGKVTVSATNDVKDPLENFWNILTGTATRTVVMGRQAMRID
jgi:hypothetical protein